MTILFCVKDTRIFAVLKFFFFFLDFSFVLYDREVKIEFSFCWMAGYWEDFSLKEPNKPKTENVFIKGRSVWSFLLEFRFFALELIWENGIEFLSKLWDVSWTEIEILMAIFCDDYCRFCSGKLKRNYDEFLLNFWWI